MFNGKMKAVTFSYDDGVTQDKRLIKMLNKYDLKCTFNINSGTLGSAGLLNRMNVTVSHVKPRPDEVRAIYEGHEIAVHTLTHPNLRVLPDEEIIRQVEEDRIALSELAGYEVVGMAYPGGTGCFDAHVADLIRSNTGVKYSRTTTSTYNFDTPQKDLLAFDPTVYHMEWDKMFDLAEKFIEMKPDSPKVFYIWGHAYEFDIFDDWDKFDRFLALIANHDDIFYGTNKEILL